MGTTGNERRISKRAIRIAPGRKIETEFSWTCDVIDRSRSASAACVYPCQWYAISGTHRDGLLRSTRTHAHTRAHTHTRATSAGAIFARALVGGTEIPNSGKSGPPRLARALRSTRTLRLQVPRPSFSFLRAQLRFK